MANPLGQDTPIPRGRDEQILFPLERKETRKQLSCPASEFAGWDSWNLYEASFLAGKQQRPTSLWLHLKISAHTPRILESKSAKLYLWGLNEETFADEQDFIRTIRNDWHKRLAWCFDPGGPSQQPPDSSLEIIDPKQGLLRRAVPDYALLTALETKSSRGGHKSLFTRQVGRGIYADPTFRSLCPVTGQPDWATVVIAFVGTKPEPTSLRQYLAGFRNHEGFHEQCAEEIFCRLWQTGQLEELWVSLHFLRRGGIDITPVRHSPNFPLAEFLLDQPWMSGPFYRQ
jgi:7-cyano-7-deazaguanine reductase